MYKTVQSIKYGRQKSKENYTSTDLSFDSSNRYFISSVNGLIQKYNDEFSTTKFSQYLYKYMCNFMFSVIKVE